ncbi:MAG: sulfatase [Alphaproteobacteria bacterium]|nr:sulfatase [Alphaproteobacteria bacterium]
MALDRIRNVLLIAADQWRAECFSALGHPCVRTPNLDALAAEGVLFRNHFTQASPCGPARASLLAGMYLQNHRMVRNGTPLDARFTNVAKEVRAAGFDPILIGYTDTAPDPRGHAANDPELITYERPMAGFTPHLVMGPDFLPWRSHLAAKGYDVPPEPYGIYQPQPGYAGAAERGFTFAPPRYTAEDSDTAFQTDALLHYLRVRGSAPWFIHTAYLRPHWPFVAPEPYNRMYDPEQVPAPLRAATTEIEAAQHPLLAYLIAQHNSREGRYYIKDYPKGAAKSDRHHRQLIATYFGLMSELDHHIGRIVAALKVQGIYDETLLIFTCDHGENLGDHWLCGKEGYFDAAFRIPMIVRDPRAGADPTRGTIVGAFTETIDTMPTILDVLGLPIPRQCDGRSLAPFLRGETPTDWRGEVHWEFDFRSVRDPAVERAIGTTMDASCLGVIRDARRKYVHFPTLPPLFFDLEQDPGEFRDLAADRSRAGEILDYAQRMISWRMLNDERTLTGMHLGEGGIHTRER